MAVHARHVAGFALRRSRGRCNASPSSFRDAYGLLTNRFGGLNTYGPILE